MSPLAPDNLLIKAGLLTPGSKVASGMASAAPNIQQPASADSGWVPLPPNMLQKVQTGRFTVGGPAARMAMFPDEFPESKTDKPGVVMRGIRGIAAGIADMAPSTMALAAGVIDFLGADEAGAALGQASLDVSSWLNDHLAVENPNLYDHAMRGVGSMLTFILPGIGAASAAGKIAKGAGMVGNAAKAFRALTGGGAMSFLEAAVEQSQREMELIGQGMTPEEALKESAPVFWHNMGVLMATNTVAYFLPLPIKTKNEFVRRAAKAVEAAFTEGGQERAQAVIQDVASGRGEWGDFLDPKKNVTDTLVGAMVGGGTAAAFPGPRDDDAPQNVPGAPVANAPAQPPQTPPAAATPQQAPAQAAQPAQPPIPQAAPAAPSPAAPRPEPGPAPAEPLPMAPAEGFDVYTEDEEPGLTRTPAEMEAAQVAPVAPEPDISPEAPAPLRKVASEAKRRAAERKAAAQAEAAAVNAEAQRRMAAEQQPEPVPVRDKNAVVNPEYADPAAAEDVAEYERKVERLRGLVEEKKRGEYAGGHTLQELQSNLKAAGFELAAARRRLTGDLTGLERKAVDRRRASNHIGKPVSIRRPDGTAVNGKITGTPFGRVSVELETGEKITVDKENIGSPVKTPTPVTEAKQEAPAAAAGVPMWERIEAVGGTFSVDNPGGAWLSETRIDAAEQLAKNPVRGRAQGKGTGKIRHEAFPVSALIDIPGLRDEQDHIRQDNVDRLAADMAENGFKKGMTPMVAVGMDGKPYILEGNHRIRAAAQAGLATIPIEIAYYAGGEQVAGSMSPESVLKILTSPATPKAAPAQAQPAAAAGIVSMPTSEITVSKPGEFQKRENIDNEESQTNEAKMQAIMADFKPERLTPIVAWRDPVDGKLKVLDGHHTLEAAKRAGITTVNVREFTGTREEATTEAEILNDLRTANDPLSRAATVRRRRAAGMSEADIEAEARPRYHEATPTVIQLSFLNPNGQLVAAIKQLMGSDQDSDSTGNLMKIAKWIGEARRRNTNMTDAHEQEMFDVLRREMARDNKPAWAKKNDTFLKHVRGIVSAESFDPAGVINLYQDKRTLSEREYDAELEDAEAKVVEAEKAIEELTDELDGLFPVLDEKGNPKVHKSGKLKGRVMKALAAGKAVTDEDARARRLAPLKYALELAKQDLGAVIAKKESYIARERDQGGLFRLGRPSIASLNKAATARGLSPAVTQPPRDLMDEMVARAARMFGFKHVQFVTGLTTKDGRMAHGYYQPESDTVFLNVGSKEPMLTVLMHEVAHRMEMTHPDLYGQLIQILNDPANVRRGGKEIYAKDAKARGYGEVGVESEWVADGLMEASSRPEFWNVLQEKNPTLAGKLINMIVDAMKAIRRMFAASGASVDIYYNNFGPLVRQIANVAAQMQAREAAGITREVTNQIEMFRIAPIGNATAQQMREKQDVAAKKAGQHRHQGWNAGWRHVYMNMVDKYTFTYWNEKQIAKAAGKAFSLAKSPYIALRRFNSWMASVQVALEHEVRSIDGQTVLSPGLTKIIRKHGIADAIDSREFNLFRTAATLVSRRYSLKIRGIDFFGPDPSTTEYQAAEAEFMKWQKIYDDYKKANPKWGDAVDDLTAFEYALTRRGYEAGLISQEEYDYLTTTYSTFATLTNIAPSEYNVERGDPVEAGTFAHPMKRFDPNAVFMDSMDATIKRVYAVEHLIRRSQAAHRHTDFIREHRDKSRKGQTVLPGFGMRVKPKTDPVAKRVDELLKAAGLSEEDIKQLGEDGRADLEAEARIYVTSRIQPDGVIAILRDSKVEYWQLERDIYDSFMAATGPKASHPLMKFFSAQTSLLRAGAVLTPDFMARNQFRDFASSAIISQHLIRNPVDPFLVPVRILRGLSHAIKKDNVYLEFMLEAGYAQLTAQDQMGLRKSSEQTARSARTRAQRVGQAAKNPVKYVLHSHPITILQEFGKLTENSSRIAVYEKTKADLLKIGVSETEARVKAAMEARESSIDFARSGYYGQVINQIIPFFNAAVQGNDKAFRTFVRDSGGRQAAWLKATMLLTVPSVLLWALNHDDDWYKEQPIWLKNNFWLFSLDGGKTIHKMPKPFELGLMYSSLAERFLDWSVDKDPKAMKEWSDSVIKNMVAVNDKNPIASVGGLLGPMAGTMTEIVSNYDSFRGTHIVKGWLEEVAPREQFNANTSEFSKAMGGMMPGRGLSPMMIDHFIRGTFGGLGVYAAQAASEVIMMARPELKAMRPSDKQIRTVVGLEVPDWIPVIRAFAQASPAGYTRQMNDFFEIYDRGREASKTLQAFKASGAPREKFIGLYRRSGADLAMSKPAQEVAEKLGQISKRARFIESMPSDQMSRDEKRKQLDELTKARNLLVEKFLERYYQVDQRELQRQIEQAIPQLERAYGR